MDAFDVFTSEPSTTKATSSSEIENTHEIANDGSSWLIENDPTTSFQSDPITSSQEPTASNSDPFELHEQSYTLPPTAFSGNQFETGEQSYALPPIASNGEQVEADEQSYALPSTAFNDDQFESGEQSYTLPSTAFSGNQFETDEQSYALPPTVESILSDYLPNQPLEDKSSFDIFANEAFSPLEAIMKKREKEIAEKDAEENRKIMELREQAKTDLENWYNERQRQMEQKFQTIKRAESDLNKKALEKSTKQSCDWSKVIRLIDFTDGKQSTKSKRDLTRMKECIFNAKRIVEKEKFANGN